MLLNPCLRPGRLTMLNPSAWWEHPPSHRAPQEHDWMPDSPKLKTIAKNLQPGLRNCSASIGHYQMLTAYVLQITKSLFTVRKSANTGQFTGQPAGCRSGRAQRVTQDRDIGTERRHVQNHHHALFG